MYVPFADLRDGYTIVLLINTIDEKSLYPWHKGLPEWIPSKTIFNMQVVFMDTTPDLLPEKIYENFKRAITLENKQLSI